MVRLDKVDKKILHQLDQNSRQAVTAIAKNLRLSRDIVTYRIKKFLNEGVLLKYHTIIDIGKLGYTAHKIFIRLQNTTATKEEELIAAIKAHPKIVYSASYDGRFDLVVSAWSRDVKELAATLRAFEEAYEPYIAEKEMASIIWGEYSVRDYLREETLTKRKSFGENPTTIKLDDTNKALLVALGEDARTNIVQLANKLQLSADALYKRIKNLQAAGIIQGYNIVPNETHYPYLHYKILLNFHKLKNEEHFREYCRQHPNIWYFCAALGNWDYEIDLDIDTPEAFRQFLREFKRAFAEQLRNYTVLATYQTHKYNFCPSTP